MKTQELAALLDGRQYTQETTETLEYLANNNGLVIVFGGSDDLMEFRGAISDEIGAYNGTVALVDRRGLLPDREQIDNDEELEDFFLRRKAAKKIRAVWGGKEYSWEYKTDIPHATFEIIEGDDKYCRGIVFSLEDLT